MKVSSLTFYLTDDCNFHCKYCYQTKGKEYLPVQTLEKALIFFFPLLTDRSEVNFYGGEPLLAFDRIIRAAETISTLHEKSKKIVKYSLTTNGSYGSQDILDFLNKHRFSVELSFDGLVHNRQREKGSSRKTLNTLKELLHYPDIQVEVNSVFTPCTVEMLYESIKYILNLGVPSLNFSLSTIESWDDDSLEKYKIELVKLSEFLLKTFKKRGNCPVTNFKMLKRGSFSCAAGSDRFVVAPNGNVWGCFLFPDYFKGKESTPEYNKFSFGNLTDFSNHHESIWLEKSRNYSKLAMHRFSSGKRTCLFCPYYEYCRICPINAAFSGLEIGNIPEYICKLKRIEIDETKRFHQELMEISNTPT